MRRGKLGIAFVSAIAILLAFGVGTGLAGGRPTDGASGTTTTDTASALVQLKGAPLATGETTQPAKGKKIDFSSNSVKNYRAQLSALRNDFKQWLRQNAPNAKVTSEFDVALNAVAVELNGASLDTIRSAPQVESVEYQYLYRPLAHEDPDLGLIDAWEAWQLAPAGALRAGEGVKIAIIDTGIDVRHPCFSDAGYPESNAPDNLVNGGTNDKVIVRGDLLQQDSRSRASARLTRTVMARTSPVRPRATPTHLPGSTIPPTASTSRTTRQVSLRARCSATSTSSPGRSIAPARRTSSTHCSGVRARIRRRQHEPRRRIQRCPRPADAGSRPLRPRGHGQRDRGGQLRPRRCNRRVARLRRARNQRRRELRSATSSARR